MTGTTAAPAPDQQNIAAGIGFMLLGLWMFSANDALGKWLAATYSPGQILLIRSAFALVVLAPFVLKAGVGTLFDLERPRLQVVRLLCGTVETFLFYWAVSVLPLADAMTYYLAAPIFVTVLAALFLGETMRWRRWTAVAVGFLGVVIALGPTSASFGGYAFIALAGSVIYSLYLVFTRSLRGTSGLTLAAWHFIASFAAGVVTAPFTWTPFVEPFDPLLLGLLGVVSLIGVVCVNRSLQLAPASIVVPYQNTLIIWAIVFGFLVFGDVPGWSLLAGAAIIVLAGLYIFFREQKVAPRTEPEVVTGP
jgi:drug/metabolite transporter (DMT)-like permease